MAREQPLKIIWAWLGWWRIRHAALYRVNRVLTPSIGIAGGLLVWVAPRDLNIVGTNGAILLFNGLLQMLAGFFVASLAAVATFNRPSLDEVMGGMAPSLVDNNKHDLEHLTRRRFLTMLFGYLSGLSIVLYLSGSLVVVISPILHRIITNDCVNIVRLFFCAAYSAFFGNLILSSFIGLYFLIDRMHREIPESGFLDIPQRKNPEPHSDNENL